jgi:hypothetical protein
MFIFKPHHQLSRHELQQSATKHAQMTTHSDALTGGISKYNAFAFPLFPFFSQKLKVKEKYNFGNYKNAFFSR